VNVIGCCLVAIDAKRYIVVFSVDDPNSRKIRKVLSDAIERGCTI
jgi:hypothetical protein